jgi:hypothetical protein
MRQHIDNMVTREGLVEHKDRIEAPQKMVGTEIFIRKPSVPVRFFKRLLIMWTSAAIPCHPSGYDPPPAYVVCRLGRRGDSSPTLLVGC